MKRNTLLNYFTRSPNITNKNEERKNIEDQKTPQRPSLSTYEKSESASKRVEVPKSVEKRRSKARNKENECENDTSMEESPPHKRRKRIFQEPESEDSGDEYVPDDTGDASSDDALSLSECSSSEEQSVAEEDERASPPSKKERRNKQQNLANGKATPSTKKAANSSSSSIQTAGTKETTTDENWPHLRLEFLKPDKIKDMKGRSPTHPDYDPKTLYVPEDYKKGLTPGLRQWWDLKSRNFDVILFFKVGKFYEFYHMDAVIGANELNLTFMRGDFAHVGFPEGKFGKYSSMLVEKGYKLARVEQTETPEMMADRCKNMARPSKFDRVVKREICQITSPGTRVLSMWEDEYKDAESHFLLAVAEKETSSGTSMYGVCFVDTSIGIFHIGQFVDDRHSSRLRTLIAHYPPVQILYEKNQISSRTQLLFSTVLSRVLKEQLRSETEFRSSTDTLLDIREKNYFEQDVFPVELLKFLNIKQGSSLLTASEDTELGIKALGAVTWYLQRCLLDHQLISMGQFSIYKPTDSLDFSDLKKDGGDTSFKHMVLDAVTLINLNVLENNYGTTEGTLLRKLDNCSTPFGKRLLHQWICNPLGNIPDIIKRQKAITVLMDCHIMRDVRMELSQLPDLERLLSKIYAQGTSSFGHPDTRAIMFMEAHYSRKKIMDFMSTLKGFKTAHKIVEMMQEVNAGEESELLAKCCYYKSDSNRNGFPNLTEHLKYFEKAFDHAQAQKEGRIFPLPGMDPEYDEAVENLKNVENDANDYLKRQCEYFRTKVVYVGKDKKRYQLQVPENVAKKATSEYMLLGKIKGFLRYTTPKTKELLERVMEAEDKKINVLKTIRERIFSKFSEQYDECHKVVQCLATLDVLISMAIYCSSEQGVMCLPEFIPLASAKQPFVRLVDGRYPCTMGDEVFIPNNTFVGCSEEEETTTQNPPSLILVTGPNMGGKSTLMRQLGLITIMSHMGCYVPAKELKLSIVDRIFTRIGANDNIMAGESTFYVELCETSSILQHATKHSLVLIDELGRGTSTYDGTAIAAAVVNELCDMGCRTLFSTHYHSLVEDFKHNPKISLGHMSCMVENDTEDGDGSEETVTFLYKFLEGACPKSYGFNAARLAGMPQHIIKIGRQKAKDLEVDTAMLTRFRSLVISDNNVNYKNFRAFMK